MAEHPELGLAANEMKKAFDAGFKEDARTMALMLIGEALISIEEKLSDISGMMDEK